MGSSTGSIRAALTQWSLYTDRIHDTTNRHVAEGASTLDTTEAVNRFRKESAEASFWNTSITVRAENITELILERAGPVVFKTFLLELKASRLIPVIFLFCKKRKA